MVTRIMFRAKVPKIPIKAHRSFVCSGAFSSSRNMTSIIEKVMAEPATHPQVMKTVMGPLGVCRVMMFGYRVVTFIPMVLRIVLISDTKLLMYGLSKGSKPSKRREFKVAAMIRKIVVTACFRAEILKKMRNSPSMNVA